MPLQLLQIHSLRKNVKILPSFTQRYNGNYVTHLSVNHWWFTDFIA